MYKTMQKIIPTFLLAACSYAIDTHFRTGVDFSTLSLSIDGEIGALTFNSDGEINFTQRQTRPHAIPHFTAEIRKPIDDSISFGIMGSYTPIMIRKQSYHALRVGMASYLMYNQHNLLGIGLHVHHVPLSAFGPFINGYLNNLSLGIIMQGTITENIYTHFEIRRDVTPAGFKPWELYAGGNGLINYIAPLLTIKYYTGSISVGYSLPTDTQV